LAAKAPTIKGQHPGKPQFPTSNKAIVILSEAKDLWRFSDGRWLKIQIQSEMFRFAQHDTMARLFEN
jgi:hypothetical protein